MMKFKKGYNLKLISLLVAGVFLLNTSVYGIDLPNKSHLRTHLLGNSDEGNVRLKKALTYEILDQVVKAEDKSDLTLYGEEKNALLLENGKILLREELYNKYYSGNLEDNKEALQVIIHEIIESLLQITGQTNPSRYQSIKEIALNNLAALYFKTPQSSTIYRDEVLANDIWAVIFEHRLMGIKPEDIKDSNLTRLLQEGYKIIDTRGDLFGEGFNNLYRAKERVIEASREGVRFYRVATKDVISRRVFLFNRVPRYALGGTMALNFSNLLHGDTDAGQHLEEKSPQERYREKELELIKTRNVADPSPSHSKDAIVALHQLLIQKLSQPNVDANAVYEEGIKGLDEEIQKKKQDNIKTAQERMAFYISQNYPPDDYLKNTWENRDAIKGRLEEYIKRLEELGVMDFAGYLALEDLDHYFMDKKLSEPISFKEFLYSRHSFRNYYYVGVDEALKVIDDMINGVEREATGHRCADLKYAAFYINAYYDNPKVKQYIIDNNILKRLYGLYIDIIKDKKDQPDSHLFHFILHPVAIIIKHYGNDLWPDIESLHILEHVAATWHRLNKDRSMINIMDIWEAPLTKPDGVTYSELEQHTMSADSEVQLFYYGRGEEALADIVVSFSLLEGKREFSLKELDRLKIVEEVMKRISTKDLTGTRMSSRAYTQALIENLSWIYGSELVPVLKNVNLDLDMDELNLGELRQYGLRDEHIDRDTQYRNGLWWLVENYNQMHGSFWRATDIKGDVGYYLIWAFYNIMRSANEEEKREIFELMRETKFKDKFLALPADSDVRVLFKPYFDEYTKYLEKYGFLEEGELKRSIILGVGAIRGLRDNI